MHAIHGNTNRRTARRRAAKRDPQPQEAAQPTSPDLARIFQSLDNNALLEFVNAIQHIVAARQTTPVATNRFNRTGAGTPAISE